MSLRIPVMVKGEAPEDVDLVDDAIAFWVEWKADGFLPPDDISWMDEWEQEVVADVFSPQATTSPTSPEPDESLLLIEDFLARKFDYNKGQRRWPKGTPGGLGGQWMDEISAGHMADFLGGGLTAQDLLDNPELALRERTPPKFLGWDNEVNLPKGIADIDRVHESPGNANPQYQAALREKAREGVRKSRKLNEFTHGYHGGEGWKIQPGSVSALAQEGSTVPDMKASFLSAEIAYLPEGWKHGYPRNADGSYTHQAENDAAPDAAFYTYDPALTTFQPSIHYSGGIRLDGGVRRPLARMDLDNPLGVVTVEDIDAISKVTKTHKTRWAVLTPDEFEALKTEGTVGGKTGGIVGDSFWPALRETPAEALAKDAKLLAEGILVHTEGPTDSLTADAVVEAFAIRPARASVLRWSSILPHDREEMPMVETMHLPTVTGEKNLADLEGDEPWVLDTALVPVKAADAPELPNLDTRKLTVTEDAAVSAAYARRERQSLAAEQDGGQHDGMKNRTMLRIGARLDMSDPDIALAGAVFDELIGWRHFSFGDSDEEKLAGRCVQEWAKSASDGSVQAHYMHWAAQREFDLPPLNTFIGGAGIKSTDRELWNTLIGNPPAEFKRVTDANIGAIIADANPDRPMLAVPGTDGGSLEMGARKILRAIYDSTQEDLARIPGDNLLLIRGMEDVHEVSDFGTLQVDVAPGSWVPWTEFPPGLDGQLKVIGHRKATVEERDQIMRWTTARQDYPARIGDKLVLPGSLEGGGGATPASIHRYFITGTNEIEVRVAVDTSYARKLLGYKLPGTAEDVRRYHTEIFTIAFAWAPTPADISKGAASRPDDYKFSRENLDDLVRQLGNFMVVGVPQGEHSLLLDHSLDEAAPIFAEMAYLLRFPGENESLPLTNVEAAVELARRKEARKPDPRSIKAVLDAAAKVFADWDLASNNDDAPDWATLTQEVADTLNDARGTWKPLGIDVVVPLTAERIPDWLTANQFEPHVVESVNANPMTSTATSESAATSFEGTGGAMLAAVIPKVDIIGMPGAGYGCLNENEMVVLGRDRPTYVVPHNSYTGTSMAQSKIVAALDNYKPGDSGLPARMNSPWRSIFALPESGMDEPEIADWFHAMPEQAQAHVGAGLQAGSHYPVDLVGLAWWIDTAVHPDDKGEIVLTILPNGVVRDDNSKDAVQVPLLSSKDRLDAVDLQQKLEEFQKQGVFDPWLSSEQQQGWADVPPILVRSLDRAPVPTLALTGSSENLANQLATGYIEPTQLVEDLSVHEGWQPGSTEAEIAFLLVDHVEEFPKSTSLNVSLSVDQEDGHAGIAMQAGDSFLKVDLSHEAHKNGYEGIEEALQAVTAALQANGFTQITTDFSGIKSQPGDPGFFPEEDWQPPEAPSPFDLPDPGLDEVIQAAQEMIVISLDNPSDFADFNFDGTIDQLITVLGQAAKPGWHWTLNAPNQVVLMSNVGSEMGDSYEIPGLHIPDQATLDNLAVLAMAYKLNLGKDLGGAEEKLSNYPQGVALLDIEDVEGTFAAYLADKWPDYAQGEPLQVLSQIFSVANMVPKGTNVNLAQTSPTDLKVWAPAVGLEQAITLKEPLAPSILAEFAQILQQVLPNLYLAPFGGVYYAEDVAPQGKIFIDSPGANEDWPKRTWDLWGVDDAAALDEFLADAKDTPEHFMRLPLFLMNVDKLPWLKVWAARNTGPQGWDKHPRLYFDKDQRRWPKGSPNHLGGQWIKGLGGATSLIPHVPKKKGHRGRPRKPRWGDQHPILGQGSNVWIVYQHDIVGSGRFVDEESFARWFVVRADTKDQVEFAYPRATRIEFSRASRPEEMTQVLGGARRGKDIGRDPDSPPAFKRVAAGLYETEDGSIEIQQLIGDGGAFLRPAGWNVDWGTDFVYEHKYTGDAWDRVPNLLDTLIVDGAASYKDAKALFHDWWRENAASLPPEDTAPGGSRKKPSGVEADLIAEVDDFFGPDEPKAPKPRNMLKGKVDRLRHEMGEPINMGPVALGKQAVAEAMKPLREQQIPEIVAALKGVDTVEFESTDVLQINTGVEPGRSTGLDGTYRRNKGRWYKATKYGTYTGPDGSLLWEERLEDPWRTPHQGVPSQSDEEFATEYRGALRSALRLGPFAALSERVTDEQIMAYLAPNTDEATGEGGWRDRSFEWPERGKTLTLQQQTAMPSGRYVNEPGGMFTGWHRYDLNSYSTSYFVNGQWQPGLEVYTTEQIATGMRDKWVHDVHATLHYQIGRQESDAVNDLVREAIRAQGGNEYVLADDSPGLVYQRQHEKVMEVGRLMDEEIQGRMRHDKAMIAAVDELEAIQQTKARTDYRVEGSPAYDLRIAAMVEAEGELTERLRRLDSTFPSLYMGETQKAVGRIRIGTDLTPPNQHGVGLTILVPEDVGNVYAQAMRYQERMVALGDAPPVTEWLDGDAWKENQVRRIKNDASYLNITVSDEVAAELLTNFWWEDDSGTDPLATNPSYVRRAKLAEGSADAYIGALRRLKAQQSDYPLRQADADSFVESLIRRANIEIRERDSKWLVDDGHALAAGDYSVYNRLSQRSTDSIQAAVRKAVAGKYPERLREYTNAVKAYQALDPPRDVKATRQHLAGETVDPSLLGWNPGRREKAVTHEIALMQRAIIEGVIEDAGQPLGNEKIKLEAKRRTAGVTSVEDAAAYFPDAWIRRANSDGRPLKVKLRKNERAWYTYDGTIKTDGTIGTSVHESMHHIEHSNPAIGIQEWVFWQSRARGGNFGAAAEKLSRVYPNSKKEIGIRDEFKHKYSGKVYNRGAPNESWELMTMGMPALWGLENPEVVWDDTDYRRWVLGMIGTIR